MLSIFRIGLFVVCLLSSLAGDNVARGNNVALTSTVINSSGSYGGLPNFPVTNVIDGKDVDNAQFATVAQDIFGNNTPGSASYWLTPDGAGAGAFFTLDLGQSDGIGQFRIANTRNDGYGDRGTLAFSVLASNSIDGSNNLLSPVTLINNQSIAQPSSATNIPFQVYLPPSGLSFGAYRYVEFLTLQAVGGTPLMGGNGGLNEFQAIYIPEPSSIILCGFGAVGLLVAWAAEIVRRLPQSRSAKRSDRRHYPNSDAITAI